MQRLVKMTVIGALLSTLNSTAYAQSNHQPSDDNVAESQQSSLDSVRQWHKIIRIEQLLKAV